MATRIGRALAAAVAGLVTAGVVAGGALALGPGDIPADPSGGAAGAPGAGGPSPQMLATQVCAQLQGQMGAQFTAKFKTTAGCVTQVVALAAKQATACAGAADQQGCITQGLMAQATQLAAGAGGSAGAGSGSTGAPAKGITPAALATTTATQTCTAAKAQLKAKFPFATQAACIAKVKPTALKLATAALAKCKTQPQAAQQACVTKAIQAGSGQLQAALGVKKS